MKLYTHVPIDFAIVAASSESVEPVSMKNDFKLSSHEMTLTRQVIDFAIVAAPNESVPPVGM